MGIERKRKFIEIRNWNWIEIEQYKNWNCVCVHWKRRTIQYTWITYRIYRKRTQKANRAKRHRHKHLLTYSIAINVETNVQIIAKCKMAKKCRTAQIFNSNADWEWVSRQGERADGWERESERERDRIVIVVQYRRVIVRLQRHQHGWWLSERTHRARTRPLNRIRAWSEYGSSYICVQCYEKMQ